MTGWIKLHRKINEHWLWDDKPFAKGQAWIDILLRVNHENGKTVIDNRVIEVERGQTVWSIKEMASRWGWSRKKVSNFLNLLETEGKIKQKRTSKYTLLTVENYDVYQSKKHEKNINGTSEEHQKNTNKNDKNEKKNNKRQRFKYESSDMSLAKYLYKLMKENNPKAKEPNFESWANECRLMREQDNRTIQDIKNLIEWSQKHHFWKTNILSMAKLRKQFDRLYVQANQNEKPVPNRRKVNSLEEHKRMLEQQKRILEAERG